MDWFKQLSMFMKWISKITLLESHMFSLPHVRMFFLGVLAVCFLDKLSLVVEAESGNVNTQVSSANKSGSPKSVKGKASSLSAQSIPLRKPIETKSNEAKPPGRNRSPKSVWVTATSLVLVLILIILGASLWKKHGPQSKSSLPVDVFQLLGKKAVDQRNQIYFFRTGSKVLIVSSGVDGMRTLSEITDPVEVDYLTGVCKPASGEGGQQSPFRMGLNKTVSQNITIPNKFDKKLSNEESLEKDSFTSFRNS